MRFEDLAVDRHEKLENPEARAIMAEYVAITSKLPLDLFLRSGALYHELVNLLENA